MLSIITPDTEQHVDLSETRTETKQVPNTPNVRNRKQDNSKLRDHFDSWQLKWMSAKGDGVKMAKAARVSDAAPHVTHLHLIHSHSRRRDLAYVTVTFYACLD